MKFLLPLLALFSVAQCGIQSAAIKGRLTCNGQAASSVKVKLYDDDSGVDTDDLMAEGKTDTSGQFQLSGTEDEMGTIDPKLNIYHDCNDGIKPCQRKFTIFLPKSYVSVGTTSQQVYDIGQLELAGKFSGEERDCLN